MSKAKINTTAGIISLDKEKVRGHLKTILHAAYRTYTAADSLRAEAKGLLPTRLEGDTFREMMIDTCHEGSSETMEAMSEILKVLGLDGSKLYDDEIELKRGEL